MTIDSVESVGEEYQERIHSMVKSGHIHKVSGIPIKLLTKNPQKAFILEMRGLFKMITGNGVVAANASIPTKFQTIITDNGDSLGFLSKAKRFQADEHCTDAPWPGRYIVHTNFDKVSPSFSKKGTGGFASKTGRDRKIDTFNAPGPDNYYLPSQLSSRRDFSRSVQGCFALPVAEASEKTDNVPAPNAYGVPRANVGKSNNVTAESGFKSKSKRGLFAPSEKDTFPAPGHYTITDISQYRTVRVPFSCFKSLSKRDAMIRPDQYPGPCHYRPNEPVSPAHKTTYPRKHYLCIAAPAMPLPETPPGPGPGSYHLTNYDGPTKHYMSSAAFVSTTGRWCGYAPLGTADEPGPALDDEVKF